MKKLFASFAIAVFCCTMPVFGQNAGAPDREEVLKMSASLKEAHGHVSKSLAMLNREIGPDAEAATAAQRAEREELTAIKVEMEAALTSVNTATEAQWAEVKQKSEASRKRAVELVERRADH